MSDRRGLTSRVVYGSFLQLGGQAVTLLATFIATPFTIRLLGPAGYGVLSFVMVIVGYLSFADMGMGTASTRFGAMAHARGDDDAEAAVIWSSLVLAVAPAAALAGALAVGARPFVEHVLRLPANLEAAGVVCVRIAAFALLMRALTGVLNTPAMVRIRMDLVVLVTSGTATAQVVLIPIVVRMGGGLSGAVAMVACAATSSALLYAIIAVRLLPQLRTPRVSADLLKQLGRFGGAMLISMLATTLLAQSEKLLMPRYASIEALAFYAVAFQLSFLLMLPPWSMMQSLVPAFSQLHARSERASFERLYRRALHAVLLWLLPAATFITIAARPFLTLWAGPQFGRESTLPLYLLIAGTICESLAYVPNGLLVAFGRSDLIARCQIFILAPYLVASAVMIHRFGAAGAAIAWSVRAIASLALFAWLARRTSGFAFVPWPDNLRAYALGLACLLLPVALVPFVPELLRIGIAAIAVALYGIVIVTRVVTGDERAALRAMLSAS